MRPDDTEKEEDSEEPKLRSKGITARGRIRPTEKPS